VNDPSRDPRIKAWAKRLKREVRALYFAYRHPGTPLYAKVWVAAVVAYAISPIDLIPDFIPVLGYLDDAILLPVGIWLAVKMIPPEVLAECRARAAEPLEVSGRMKWAGGVAIGVLWGALLVVLGLLAWRKWFAR
jgi:uncharacterized membrane protein YkvA (DUF1232 family)